MSTFTGFDSLKELMDKPSTCYHHDIVRFIKDNKLSMYNVNCLPSPYSDFFRNLLIFYKIDSINTVKNDNDRLTIDNMVKLAENGLIIGYRYASIMSHQINLCGLAFKYSNKGFDAGDEITTLDIDMITYDGNELMKIISNHHENNKYFAATVLIERAISCDIVIPSGGHWTILHEYFTDGHEFAIITYLYAVYHKLNKGVPSEDFLEVIAKAVTTLILPVINNNIYNFEAYKIYYLIVKIINVVDERFEIIYNNYIKSYDKRYNVIDYHSINDAEVREEMDTLFNGISERNNDVSVIEYNSSDNVDYVSQILNHEKNPDLNSSEVCDSDDSESSEDYLPCVDDLILVDGVDNIDLNNIEFETIKDIFIKALNGSYPLKHVKF